MRPEHFTVSDSGLPAEVVVVEPTGSETQVFAKLGQKEVVGIFRERISIAPGDRIMLAPNPGLVHLFDAETGVRI